MIVSGVLVSHDGARWLPTVLQAVRRQSRGIDRGIAIDTGSKDSSPDLIRESFGAAAVIPAPAGTSFPEAVRKALELLPPAGRDEWIWILHDDSTPDRDALAHLVAAVEADPKVDVVGPKLREWPSLRRLQELGITISGTGRRETGLERGEYDQGQHDEVREVLAVNTAGMLVRRRVLEDLGGFDEHLPIFGNDLDFGWRAARAGYRTLIVPDAVVFHAEAAHRGVRRTPLTGRHTHYQERRAALYTLLANTESRRLPWQVVRLFFGSLLRALGFLLVRSPGEALDEVAALASVYSRPATIRAARQDRRSRGRRRRRPDREVRALLAPWWVPYRHGLDFLSDLSSALAGQAMDVAERRRAARSGQPTAGGAGPGAPAGSRRPTADDEDEETLLADTGLVARVLSNPVALAVLVFVVLALVAARTGFGEVVGGALSPVPQTAGDWWRLHAETRHPLGTGTDVPAPAYVAVFALLGSLLGGPGVVVSAVMVLAVPFALWGAWRLLRVVGHLVDPDGFPTAALAWGATTYALVPATSGAWGEGRFGTVVLAALLPWVAHAALGFADPEADRRWRAGWRTGLLLALATAFVPGMWLFGLLAAVIVVAAGFAISPRLLRDRSAWGPPAVALGVVPLLLAPWLLPLVTTGSAQGLLLEAGRLPVASADTLDLVSGRLGELGAPWVLGVVVAVAAVLAILPAGARVPVLICWIVALAAAVVVAALAAVRLELPATTTPPTLGFFVVVLQGVAVVAAMLGLLGWLLDSRRAPAPWRRAVTGVVAVALTAVPVGGLGWWLVVAEDSFDVPGPDVVPAYMAQSAQARTSSGALVLRGAVDTGVTYRVRRGDGITVGEDEILSLAPEDTALTAVVSRLVTAPTDAEVEALGAAGIEYVVLGAPADSRIASVLDSATGLVQASTEDRSSRAWRVDRPLDASDVDSRYTPGRIVLLAVQGVGVVLALVLAAPTVSGRREES